MWCSGQGRSCAARMRRGSCSGTSTSISSVGYISELGLVVFPLSLLCFSSLFQVSIPPINYLQPRLLISLPPTMATQTTSKVQTGLPLAVGNTPAPKTKNTMSALRFHGKEDLRLEQIEEPKCGKGQIKIKPAWCGICGSGKQVPPAAVSGTTDMNQAESLADTRTCFRPPRIHGRPFARAYDPSPNHRGERACDFWARVLRHD